MQGTKKLSLFSFFSMTAALFITVYGYPTFAESGKTLIFFLLLCGIFWFLPTALVAAEMASTDEIKEGGIFGWVGNTLGEKYGFAAIFFQWFQVTVGFVTMIYFIIGALSEILNMPELNNNKMIKFALVLVIFWVFTFIQMKGTKLTSQISKIGFIFGIIIPVIVLLILTIKYVVSGQPIAPSYSDKPFFPTGKNFSALVTFMIAYMGVEASAPKIDELDNPSKNYPLMMIYLVIVGIVLSAIGGVAVSMVVPADKIGLNTGVIEAFKALLPGASWAVKTLSVLVTFGVLAQVSSWIVSPTSGLLFVAKKGLLPAKFKGVNKAGVPVPLLIVQGIVVSVWAAVLTFSGGSGSGGGSQVSFLTAVSLSVIIYLSAYVLFYLGYFALILKKENQSMKRTYQVPGGKTVKVIVASFGFIISVLAMISSFIPSAVLKGSEATAYIVTLTGSFIVTLIIPFAFYHFYSKKHRIQNTPATTSSTKSKSNTTKTKTKTK